MEARVHCFRIEAGLPPRNPAELKQLDPAWFPLNPPGDFAPPVPPGSGGMFFLTPDTETT